MKYLVTIYGKHDIVYGKTIIEAETKREAYEKGESWYGSDDWDSIGVIEYKD